MSVTGPPGTGQVPQVESPSLVGQILDGRYRIVRKLGEGGMGEVYAADHVHIEKKFAIKLLRPEIVSNAEAVTRFRQEARSSSSIGHRNIIAIEDFGQLSDGRIYMCMELLNGAALNDMITQPMGMDRLLNILIQTGHGLAAAHAKHIIHRDMKPENIFVTIGPNGEDVPKLLDFGIAKVSGNDGQNHLTRTGTIFGTPFYMAPEQALGNPVDARTDIYAVGVIMYECFSGTLPFQGDSFMGILTQHITMEPEPVAQRAAKAGRQLPPGLAETITRCMQKNPAQRFQTMDELVNALIQIYRGVVGPGMSTYMEAFPVMPSAMHQVQPTPTPQPGMPMTGPVLIGNATAPTIAAGRSGSGPVLATPSSGVYPAAPYPAPKSRLGLIIALLAVLAVGGGIAAFMVVNGNHKPGPGAGSGSQVVDRDPGLVPRVGRDAAVALAPDAADIAAVVPDAAVEHVIPTEVPDAGTAGNTLTPPEVPPVQVLLSAKNVSRFEVYENGAKLFDGPDLLPVNKGETRNVVIKAFGFKDKALVVDSTKRKVQFALARLPGSVGPGPGHGSSAVTPGPGSATVPVNPPPNNGNPGPGSGHVYTPNLPPDCSSKILDPRSKACVDQYCAKHPDEDKCHMM
ncbi:MAG TPA: serine/threonine-protein kinase [Kofleriaceae bacterium]|jgi:serine/threonine-protein kinase|nr:serine/threonine-protein kinase [Kofleriaceae bacterium]